MIEPDNEGAISSSNAVHLFVSGWLQNLLHERYEIAIREFSEALNDFDLQGLSQIITDRLRPDPLTLGPDAQLRKLRRNAGRSEHEYAIPFYGDPFLWYLSPNPIRDTRPQEAFTEEWLTGLGWTLNRPFGEIMRGELVLFGSHADVGQTLRLIRRLVGQQHGMILKWEETLKCHLAALSRPPLLQ